jgi:hypothetical protein
MYERWEQSPPGGQIPNGDLVNEIFAGRTVDRELATADFQSGRADVGEGHARGGWIDAAAATVAASGASSVAADRGWISPVNW